MAFSIDHIFQIPLNKINRLFLVPKPDISKWMRIPVRDIVLWMYYFGIFSAFYISLTPWPLWIVFPYVGVIASLPILLSFLMSHTLGVPLFTRKDFVLPALTCAICVFVMAFLGRKNALGFLGDAFSLVVFFSLFTLNQKVLIKIGDALSKSMGFIVLLSMIAFVLHLMRFPLLHFPIGFPYGDYTFENYIFFLIDDRAADILIPRFHSIFLEPSHMSMACVALLLTQMKKWKKWYNKSMFAAILFSFSLAGYIFLVVLYFVSSWIKHKSIVKQILLFASVLAVVVSIALVYNDGENMVNELILQRLEMSDDGKLAGDNRVTESFDGVYRDFSNSDKILYGEGLIKYEKYSEGGNAGYKVFLFCYGLISLFFLILFFLTFAHTSRFFKQKVIMLVVSFISFIPHGYPLIFYFFIPLYIMIFKDFDVEQEGKIPLPTSSRKATGEMVQLGMEVGDQPQGI